MVQSSDKLPTWLARAARPFRAPPPMRIPPNQKTRLWLDDDQPLDLEIGCGVGWHPIQYATTHEDRRLIAIEHTAEKFKHFQHRIDTHPQLADRLIGVHANAISFIAHHVPAKRLDRVFLLYPNPHPKSKHINQRWHAMPFMQELLGKIRQQGSLTIVTNERWYIDQAREAFATLWTANEIDYFSFDQNSAIGRRPRTHFEKKYLAAEQTCYQASWQPS